MKIHDRTRSRERRLLRGLLERSTESRIIVRVTMTVTLLFYVIWMVGWLNTQLSRSSSEQNKQSGINGSTAVLDLEPSIAGKQKKTIKPLLKRNNSSLRFDWTNLPPITPLGKIIDRSQSQCKNESFVREFGPLEVVSFNLIPSGMGSSLHTWVNPLCHASLSNKVLVTGGKWLWNDMLTCPEEIEKSVGQKSDATPQHRSPLWCYFGSHESGLHCPSGTVAWDKPKVDFGAAWGSYTCEYEGAKTGWDRGPIYDAAAEWLFQNVSKLVIHEAERQIREEAFPEEEWMRGNSTETAKNLDFQPWPLPNADSLITVHIRWGDKKREMELVTLEEYINGTTSLLTEDEISGVKDVHVYVVTEDPNAVNQFRESSPVNWKIHSSGPKNPTSSSSMMQAATRSKGRAGLESLAALLISLEANRYVLVSGSNWSRLINELRKSVVDSRCGQCTKMIDLSG